MDAQQFLISIYLAQALAAALLAWVFQRYWRVYDRAYLGIWSLSFLALAFYLLSGAGSHYMAASGMATHMLRTPLSAFSLVMAYAHVVLILFGVRALDLGRAPARLVLSASLVAAAAFGLASAVAYSGIPDAQSERLLLRVGVRNGVTGIAYLATFVLLLRTAKARESFGRRMAGLAFAVYGAGLTASAALMLVETQFGPVLTIGTYLGAFDLVAKVMLGMGLVIWLLEDERARALAARREIERVSLHDPLTGFANRRHLGTLLDAAIQRARHTGSKLAVLVTGLDRFQAVNNAYGSDCGDEILAGCAARLEPIEGETQAGRLEGDQFALTLAVKDADEAAREAQALLRLLDEPYRIGPLDIHVPASLGVAMYPDDGSDSERLINNAALALRQAKRHGGHSAHFYAPALNDQARKRLSLQIELRQALAEDEFDVAYQPLLRAADGSLAGFEALARWRHPRHGLWAPDRFVPALEEIGRLPELDMLIVQRALGQLARWRDDGAAGLSVTVNLCARTFQRLDLADRLHALLDAARLPPGALGVEITESSALDDLAASTRTLARLNRLGIRVWLDDFGTGHSSLAQLLRLPVHGLKLDRSFLDQDADLPRQGALVIAIVQLASSLGMHVLAEGVETEAQARFVGDRGVQLVQGYLYGRPCSAQEATRWLAGATRAAG